MKTTEINLGHEHDLQQLRDWLSHGWRGFMFTWKDLDEGRRLDIRGFPADTSAPQELLCVKGEQVRALGSTIGSWLLTLGYENRLGTRDIYVAVQWSKKQ